MKNSFSFLVLSAVSLVLILVVVSYYLFSKIAASTKADKTGSGAAAGNDALRKLGVTDLASKISYLTSDASIVWPTNWQQLGSGSADCQVQTLHCQVSNSECFDLETMAHNKFKLPLDAVEGSEEKTGYAIKREGNKLLIRACYTDSDIVISQELRITQ